VSDAVWWELPDERPTGGRAGVRTRRIVLESVLS
jgi:hypothetical protein